MAMWPATLTETASIFFRVAVQLSLAPKKFSTMCGNMRFLLLCHFPLCCVAIHHVVLNLRINRPQSPQDHVVAYSFANGACQRAEASVGRSYFTSTAYHEVHLMLPSSSDNAFCLELTTSTHVYELRDSANVNRFVVRGDAADFSPAGLGTPLAPRPCYLENERALVFSPPSAPDSSPPPSHPSPRLSSPPPPSPQPPIPSVAQACAECLREGEGFANPFCTPTAACSMSTLEAVLHIFRHLLFPQTSAYALDQGVQRRVNKCIAPLSAPVETLTANDVMVYTRHRLASSVPAGYACNPSSDD